MKDIYNLKKAGYRVSNFKGILETDPETFEKNKEARDEFIKKMGWKKRECGSCNLCCKLVPVPALKKDSHEWCKNCNIGVGCKIYKERPLDCQAFSCAYAMGMTTESFKPDKVGFYMAMDSPNDMMLGMFKVYTEKHRLANTIRFLKKVRFGIPTMKGFHISYGPSKEQSYFLHEEYEKGPDEYYGMKSFQELKEWATKDMPQEILDIIKEKYKGSW